MNLQHILNKGQQQPKLADQMQTEPYRVQKIGVEIISDQHQLSYPDCVIEIDESCFSVIISTLGEDQKVVSLLFSNISSVGIQGNEYIDKILEDKILVFLEGQENQDYQGGQEQDNENPPPMPEILALINQSQTGTFNLQGNFTLALSFSQHSQQKKTQAHELMIGYLKSEQEQEEDNFMDEMISADQINEDGTINKFNGENDDGSEDDSDQIEEGK